MAAIAAILEVAASPFSLGTILVAPLPFLKISGISQDPFKSYHANSFFKMVLLGSDLEKIGGVRCVFVQSMILVCFTK